MSEEGAAIKVPCRNVFILGLDDFQLSELGTITDAKNMKFHQILEPEVVKFAAEHSFHTLLTRAREQLKAFDGTIDAIIAHWDFPSSVLMPILAREWGLPTASLASVIACEHKYWSRVEQAASIPEVVPAFNGFDPFDDNALDRIRLEYPFWIKPVKSHSSQLGFMVRNAEDFHQAIPEIRAHIREIGDSFNEAAKCFIWTGQMDDGIVRRVPSTEEIARVTEEFPEIRVHIAVKVGDRLSELREQTSYGYDLATLVIGAARRDDLARIHDRCRDLLPVEIDRM